MEMFMLEAGVNVLGVGLMILGLDRILDTIKNTGK